MSGTVSTSAIGAAQLVAMLERLDVELVFGLPGVHNLSVFKALAESEIRLIGVRHEQTAAYAADGYARATGRLGVALVTTGPGAANTLGATGEAMAAGSPVLVIATDIPTALRRPGVYRGVLHETRDQTAMFAPVTKGTRVVATADEITAAVQECVELALRAPSGPVYLGIPTDLLNAACAGSKARPPARRPPVADTDLKRAAELLADASRPLIWAGGGALRSGAGPQVGELALRLAAPVMTTFQGRGLIAPDHPCAVPGPVHAPQIGPLWDCSDLVISIGSDLDGVMTQNWLMPQPPKLLAINVDAADASKNYHCDLTLEGDASEVLERLLPIVAGRDGLDELRAQLRALRSEVDSWVLDDEPRAAALLAALDAALPDDAVVVVDMCIPGYWIGGYRRVPLPRKLAYPLGWGTLGFGFPASLGAAIAGAGPAVCVTGDGGFMYACGELATVAQERIPVTIVLVDDGGYGMLRYDQRRAGDEPFGVDLTRPDFAALAASFGLPAFTFDGFGGAFEAALRSSVAGGEPQVLIVNAALKPPPNTSPRWYRRS